MVREGWSFATSTFVVSGMFAMLVVLAVFVFPSMGVMSCGLELVKTD